MRGPWEYEDPSCASVGGNFWFPEKDHSGGLGTLFNAQSEEVKIAKSICNSCVHKTECRQWGLEHEKHGIWGGLAENERRPIRQRLNIIVKEVGFADVTASVGDSSHQSYTSS
jgi:hypothetical protein